MSMPSTRQEIDHRTIKLLVGLVAISIAPLTSVLASSRIASISASYYEGGWPQSIFVGFLFAIGALLVSYNGHDRTQMRLSKTAAGAALGVALFPCQCDTHQELIRGVHALSAAVMFGVLTYFCYAFYQRAKAKGHSRAKARCYIYLACGSAILLSIIVLSVNGLSGDALRTVVPRLTFYGEATGLIAFGIAWLTASHCVPLITAKEELFSPFTASSSPPSTSAA
jgi:hypothetical protein